MSDFFRSVTMGVRPVYSRVYPNRLTRKEVLDLKASIFWFFLWSREAVNGERFNPRARSEVWMRVGCLGPFCA